MRLFVDDWEQASHGGDTAAAVDAGLISRGDVTKLGAVLAGDAPGRQHENDITVFDSTGLAIQDLAIALAAMEHADELDLPALELWRHASVAEWWNCDSVVFRTSRRFLYSLWFQRRERAPREHAAGSARHRVGHFGRGGIRPS